MRKTRHKNGSARLIVAWWTTFCKHIKTAEQRTIIQQYSDWYTGRWRMGCYIWYSQEGPGRGAVNFILFDVAL